MAGSAYWNGCNLMIPSISKRAGKGRWKCECKCGAVTYVKTNALISGNTMSCGCYKNDLCCEVRKPNTYDLSDEYGIGVASDGVTKFFFDKEDFEKIKAYNWRCHPSGYMVSTNKTQGILMHRLIMDVIKSDDIVDHIGHNLLDNRKCNLRITTHNGNLKNKSISKRNKSGVTGVCWEERSQKWHSYIWTNGKTIHLGRFDNFDDAVNARKEAEVKYFGSFSYDASMNYYHSCSNVCDRKDVDLN